METQWWFREPLSYLSLAVPDMQPNQGRHHFPGCAAFLIFCRHSQYLLYKVAVEVATSPSFPGLDKLQYLEESGDMKQSVGGIFEDKKSRCCTTLFSVIVLD